MKIVTLNTGTKFKGYDYEGKLFRGLKRHTKRKFNFEVITESKYEGWWGKLECFNPSERIIFLDLDTIICGDWDFLLDYKGPFAILRDFFRPTGYGSAIMSIGPHTGAWLKTNFEINHERIIKDLGNRGDQGYIEDQVLHADLWQDMYPGKIKSFKGSSLYGADPECAIVCFHGYPKPHEAMDTPLVKEHWI